MQEPTAKRDDYESSLKQSPAGVAEFEQEPEWLIDKLVGLGVARETAEGYGHRQAHGVLRSMQAKQINDRKSRSGGSNGFDPNGPANDNQRRFLERHGRNPNVPYCEAARLIALIQMG